MNDWMQVDESTPQRTVLLTKIDNADGCRNEQELQLIGNLWWFADRSMYVYYRPTHWKPIQRTGMKSWIV